MKNIEHVCSRGKELETDMLNEQTLSQSKLYSICLGWSSYPQLLFCAVPLRPFSIVSNPSAIFILLDSRMKTRPQLWGKIKVWIRFWKVSPCLKGISMYDLMWAEVWSCSCQWLVRLDDVPWAEFKIWTPQWNGWSKPSKLIWQVEQAHQAMFGVWLGLSTFWGSSIRCYLCAGVGNLPVSSEEKAACRSQGAGNKEAAILNTETVAVDPATDYIRYESDGHLFISIKHLHVLSSPQRTLGCVGAEQIWRCRCAAQLLYFTISSTYLYTTCVQSDMWVAVCSCDILIYSGDFWSR